MEPLEKPKSALDLFREEITSWIVEQQKKRKAWEARGRKGESYDPHSNDIDPNSLTETDRIMWEGLKKGNVSVGDIEEYRNAMIKEIAGATEMVKKSRGAFYALVVNMASPNILEQEMREASTNTP